MKEAKNLFKVASQALEQVDNGGLYQTQYVKNRLQAAIEKYPTDIVIGTMLDTMTKMASKQEFISKKEVTAIYSRVKNLSKSSFENVLSDIIIPVNTDVMHKASALRVDDDSVVKTASDHTISDLSNAFSSILGFEKKASKSVNERAVKRVLEVALHSMRRSPVSIDIVSANDIMALSSVSFRDHKFNKVAIQLPVVIAGTEPEIYGILSGQDVVEFNSENLDMAIKEARDNSASTKHYRYAEDRGSKPVSDKQYKMADDAELRQTLIASTKGYTVDQVRTASFAATNEMLSAGFPKINLKVSNATNNELVLAGKIPLENGAVEVSVPVPLYNGQAATPTSFIVSSAMNEDMVFDLSKSGYNSFISKFAAVKKIASTTRLGQNLNEMGFESLLSEIDNGVASKDYARAEDALAQIQASFDSDKSAYAFKRYASIMKATSTHDEEREMHIQAAIKSKKLIKHANTIELYCPMLGLPLSKIAFDRFGDPIPANRKNLYDAEPLEGLDIMSSRIYLT
jgi:hypothetical protein